jgi:hypothetical protein
MEKEIARPGAVTTIKKFFGLKEGDFLSGLEGFLTELKDLIAEEKNQLADGIDNGSYTY